MDNESLVKKIGVLERALKRERKAKEILETSIEDKTRTLYMAKEYYNNIFNTVHTGLILFSQKGEALQFNNSFMRFFQESDEDLMSSSFDDLFRGKNISGKNKSLNFKSFQLGKEYELVLKNVETTAVSCSFSSLYDQQMKMDVVAVAVTDLTESKKINREKTAMQEKLIEGAFREGLAENAVAILHNIGNILTVILGKVSNNKTLRNFKDFEEQLKEIDGEEVDGGEVLAAIIGEIEEYSKSFEEAFRFVTSKSKHIAEVIAAQQRYANLKQDIKSRLEVGELLNDCLLMHEDRLLKRKIEVNRAGEEGALILVEKNGMAQTLSNIIVNASESIEQAMMELGESYEGGVLKLKTTVEERFVIISIEDNGMGVEESVLKNLFDFGFSTKQRDSGFGLHNCANFIRKSEGEIKLLSDGKYKGARMILKLPVVE